MKRIFSFFAIITTIFMLGTVVAADASDFTYTVNEDGKSVTISKYNGAGGNVTIPEEIGKYSVTVIGKQAFYKCGELKGISFPDTVVSIEKEAFYGCSGLTDISFSEGLSSIGVWAFAGCNKLTSISFPQGLTSIGGFSFYGCRELTNITFSEGLLTIEQNAFNGCNKLSEVSFPDGLSSIGYRAFYDCDGLTSISFPNGLTSIGGYAFHDCDGLISVSFQEGLSVIGAWAFWYCDNLISVKFYGDVPSSWGEYSFDSDVTIYYLEGNTSGWTSPRWVATDGRKYYTETFKLPDIVTKYLQITINNTNKTYYVGDDVHIALTDVTKTEKYNSSYIDLQYTKPQNLLLTNSDDTVLQLNYYNDISHDSAYIEYTFKAMNVGTTIISIDDDISEETFYLPITVIEDEYKSYRADKAPTYTYDAIVAKDEYNYMINGMYISDFKCSDNKDGTWQYTFNAYNELYTPGVVEVYNAKGELIDIEIIDKFSDLASLKEIIDAGGDMFWQIITGDTFSFRGVSSAKETPVSLSVPQDGFMRITNSCAVSQSCFYINMFDYIITGLGIIDNDYNFDNSVKDYITKETLWKVLYSDIGIDLLEKIQKKFTSKALESISENAVRDYYQIISSDITNLLNTLEIDLAEIAKGSVESTLWGSAQDSIEKYGGPAGAVLNGIFTVQDALNFYYQTKDLLECSKSRSGVDIWTPVDKSYREITSLDGNYVSSIADLPDETILQIFKLTDNEEVNSIENTRDYTMYEISLHVDGAEFQPEAPITVYLRKPYGFGEDLDLYRQSSTGEWEKVEYTIQNGMLVFQIDHFCLFTIIDTLKPGDINMDGVINEIDSSMFIKYFTGHDVVITPVVADIDNNGKLTRRDAMILARVVAGWSGYTLPWKEPTA